MKRLKYLLLLSVSCFSSAFASSFVNLSGDALTCPQAYPSSANIVIDILGPNYYANHTPIQNIGNNTFTYSYVMVNAANADDAKAKIRTISTSGLTAFSSQAIQYRNTPGYYCAYHSSNYPLTNESPDAAFNSNLQAAYVIFYINNTK